jgi:predicted acylesterase/phospholipase RssA
MNSNPNPTHSNEPLTIVLSGGSVRGFYMLGALQYIDEQYDLQHISSYFGTSVGAIFSYMICLGMKPLEIVHHVIRSKILEQIRNIRLDSLFSVQQGVLDFEPILEELELLTLSRYEKCFTLKSLYEELGKELGCVTVNYTKNQTEYMHHTTTPDLPCLTAIQMSASIPFVFNKCIHKGYIYIDGGFTDNFPIRMATHLDKTNIIGVSSVESRQPQHTLTVMNIITLPMFHQSRKTIKKFKKRFKIINIPSNENIFNFNLDVPTIMEMFSTGYKTSKAQLDSNLNKK